MTRIDWLTFLSDFNDVSLAISPLVRNKPPFELGMNPLIRRHPNTALAELAERVVSGQARWMGMPPATTHQIRAAEVRLNVDLPASYRSFLEVSNGFLLPGCSISALLSVELIRPFGEDHAGESAFWRDVQNDDTGELALYVQSRLEGTIQISGPPNESPEFVLLDPCSVRPGSGPRFLQLMHEGPTDDVDFEEIMTNHLEAAKYLLKLLTGCE